MASWQAFFCKPLNAILIKIKESQERCTVYLTGTRLTIMFPANIDIRSIGFYFFWIFFF